jgi:hypothetical protein
MDEPSRAGGDAIAGSDAVRDASPGRASRVERVQLGVRIEKRMAQVLKGLAEFKGVSLGELLEEIVLHSFEPVPGQEGQQCASPHSKASLQAIAGLKQVYGMNYHTHASYGFQDAIDHESTNESTNEEAK